jgi:tight adherence protein C
MPPFIGALVVMFGLVLVVGAVVAPKPPPRQPLVLRRITPVEEAAPADPIWVRALARLVRRVQPASRERQLEHTVRRAGQPTGYSAERIMAYKLLGAVTFGVLGFLYMTSRPGAMGVLVFVVGLASGWVVPGMLISSRADERRREIQDGLPDAIDQLAVTVRAGLSVDAGLARVAVTVKGPLAEELSRVVQDMQLGVPRATALRSMADRIDLPELNFFVRALVQSDALGVPVASTLATQSEDMRLKRRLRAEEEAMKLPVKILAPTVLCILPALLLVVLGPAVIQMGRNLSL